MPYTKQTWVDGSSGQTPLNASRLNYMEDGIAAAATSQVMVSVKDSGAKGDGTTDDTAAIQAAVAAVAGRNAASGVVYFPAGTYLVKAALSVPRQIYLVGEHAGSTVIKLGSTSTVGTFLTFGTSGQIATFTGLRDIAIDANSKANVGVQLWGPQEGSGLQRVFVGGALNTGVQAQGGGVVGGTNMFTIDHSWIWTTGNGGTYGLAVDGGLVHVQKSTFAATNRTAAAPAGSAGIAVWDGTIVIVGTNTEQWESGYLFNRSGATLITPQCFFTSYGATTSADSTDHPLTITGAGWNNSVSDINDVGAGVTGLWANSYHGSGSLSNPRRFIRGWHNLNRQDIYRSDSQRSAVGYTSPADGDTTHLKSSVLTSGSGWRVGSFTDGTDGTNGAYSSAWNGGHHRIGSYHLWVDASGRLRIKNGAPISDTDGTVVGTQA